MQPKCRKKTNTNVCPRDASASDSPVESEYATAASSTVIGGSPLGGRPACASAADHKIIAKGNHQTKSSIKMNTPTGHGISLLPKVTKNAKITKFVFKKPSKTSGQCRIGEREANKNPNPKTAANKPNPRHRIG